MSSIREVTQAAYRHGYERALRDLEAKQQRERNASLTWHSLHTGMALIGFGWSLFWWLRRRGSGAK